jgi:hypothetical protein
MARSPFDASTASVAYQSAGLHCTAMQTWRAGAPSRASAWQMRCQARHCHQGDRALQVHRCSALCQRAVASLPLYSLGTLPYFGRRPIRRKRSARSSSSQARCQFNLIRVAPQRLDRKSQQMVAFGAFEMAQLDVGGSERDTGRLHGAVAIGTARFYDSVEATMVEHCSWQDGGDSFSHQPAGRLRVSDAVCLWLPISKHGTQY